MQPARHIHHISLNISSMVADLAHAQSGTVSATQEQRSPAQTAQPRAARAARDQQWAVINNVVMAMDVFFLLD